MTRRKTEPVGLDDDTRCPGVTAGAVTPLMIVHLPHASRYIPAGCRNRFVLDRAGLDRELDRLTDHFTDELFAMHDPRLLPVLFPVSRLVVDPERFADDTREPMAAGLRPFRTRDKSTAKAAAGLPIPDRRSPVK